MEYFDHIHQSKEKLQSRHVFLKEHQKKLTGERLQAVQHELACVAFELDMIDVDEANDRDRDWDPPTQPIDVEAIKRMLE